MKVKILKPRREYCTIIIGWAKVCNILIIGERGQVID